MTRQIADIALSMIQHYSNLNCGWIITGEKIEDDYFVRMENKELNRLAKYKARIEGNMLVLYDDFHGDFLNCCKI
jgi:hypothetical protein